MICRFGYPYQTNGMTKDATGRKSKKNVNRWLESSHELNHPTPIPKLVEGISLILKNFEYCIQRVAVFECGDKWVCRKVRSCLLSVFP